MVDEGTNQSHNQQEPNPVTIQEHLYRSMAIAQKGKECEFEPTTFPVASATDHNV